MPYLTRLKTILQERLPWNGARIDFVARFTIALLKVCTTNLTEVALALKGSVKRSSNYRRIQRFLAEYAFDFHAFGEMLLGLLPESKELTLILDRTEWHLGTKPKNVFMVAIAYKGIAFPLIWSVLPKSGASNTAERMRLVEKALTFIPVERIEALVGDREFIGTDWLGFLRERNIPFVMRLRKDIGFSLWSDGPTLPAQMFFRGHTAPRVLREVRYIGEVPVRIVGHELSGEGEFLIIATTIDPEEALSLYRQRWEIETLFAALKSRGFEMEATHLYVPDRLAKLVGLLALGFVWAHLVGQWRDAHYEELQVKTHGRLEKSLFRHGLDYLRECVLNLPETVPELMHCIRALQRPRQFLAHP